MSAQRDRHMTCCIHEVDKVTIPVKVEVCLVRKECVGEAEKYISKNVEKKITVACVLLRSQDGDANSRQERVEHRVAQI